MPIAPFLRATLFDFAQIEPIVDLKCYTSSSQLNDGQVTFGKLRIKSIARRRATEPIDEKLNVGTITLDPVQHDLTAAPSGRSEASGIQD